MKRFIRPTPLKVLLLALLTFLGTTPRVTGESPVKLNNFIGAIDITAAGVRPFTLSGTASHLGKFTAYGEVVFVPGEDPGSLEGEGVAVFRAANGDLLVGVMTWDVAAGGNFRTTTAAFRISSVTAPREVRSNGSCSVRTTWRRTSASSRSWPP